MRHFMKSRDADLINPCHGNMDRAVNDSSFALFSMGAHFGGVTPYTGMS